MVSVFRYNVSQLQAVKILKGSSGLIDKKTFKGANNIEYDLIITGEGFYIGIEDKALSPIYPYKNDFNIPIIEKINIEQGHSIYVYIDVEEELKKNIDFQMERFDFLFENAVDEDYLQKLAYITNYNDEDFFFLCFVYFVFRLKKQSLDLNIYIRNKLDYYGYTIDDFNTNVPYNNSTNPHFLKMVNLALDVLYNSSSLEIVSLEDYSLTKFVLSESYIKYYL